MELKHPIPENKALTFKNVSRVFASERKGKAITAIENVSFSVNKGEFVALVGPSGCGKSTILNLTSGLDKPSAGDVYINGEKVIAANPKVGFMLQKDLLLPWRTIQKNVEFGLETHNISAIERQNRAFKELQRCKIADFADSYPYQLSGGMRQRAALARTLAIDPELLLLDEPFSALDAQTKMVLQKSFAETIFERQDTCLLITHDLHEAIVMADRVLIMSERPGTIIEEVVIDMPHRYNPHERRMNSKTAEYINHLYNSLKLNDKL